MLSNEYRLQICNWRDGDSFSHENQHHILEITPCVVICSINKFYVKLFVVRVYM